MNLLNLLLALPALAAGVMMVVPRQTRAVRRMALVLTSIIFLASLSLLPEVLSNPAEFHYETNIQWIASPEVHYHVGIDALSVWLLVLTSLLGVLATLISWRHIHGNLRKFYALLLVLMFGIFGSLSSLDLFLFYVFWEMIMVPMTFLVGIWGREKRVYASVRYFLYTIVGSLFMLASIIYLSVRAGTFDYVKLVSLLSSGALQFSAIEELLLFLGFLIAFAVKVPLFPLHGWMPGLHGETAPGGPVDIAATMAKIGPYGILRFCLPLFPGAARDCAPWIVVLCITGILTFALIALVQTNMKKLVAYSSMSHMGVVTLGIFSFTALGANGAVYLLIAHSITASALFMLIGFLYDRRRSVCIEDFGGVASTAPRLASVFMITMLAAIGLPTLSNFVGEFMVLQGAAQANFSWAVIAAIGTVLSACYMLWLYQRTFLGPIHKIPAELPHVHHAPHFDPEDMHDLRRREWMAVMPLLALMFLMGLTPQLILPSLASVNAKILARTSETGVLNAAVHSYAPRVPVFPATPAKVRSVEAVSSDLAGL